jgi:hypothetical protein
MLSLCCVYHCGDKQKANPKPVDFALLENIPVFMEAAPANKAAPNLVSLT